MAHGNRFKRGRFAQGKPSLITVWIPAVREGQRGRILTTIHRHEDRLPIGTKDLQWTACSTKPKVGFKRSQRLWN